MLKIVYNLIFIFCITVGSFVLAPEVSAQQTDTIPAEKKVNLAYGTFRSKTELTAAVSSVSGEELSKAPVSVLNDAIQGRISGLTVLRTSGSEPGWTSSNFFVRGTGTFGNGLSPLFLIDNVERDITQLDPEEIESLSVLKDAAALVFYGMRGANGVINIKTKRGVAGKPQITFKAQYGLQQASRLPKYLGSAEYVKYRNVALQNDGLPIPSDPRYNPEMYNGSQDTYQYPNTDWYKEFIKKTSPQQMYKLGITGGVDRARYFVLFGITNQNGLFNYGEENSGYSTNYDYKRYNVRSNIDVDLTKYLSISLDLAGRVETKNAPANSSSQVFTSLSQFLPVIPVKNRDGSIAGTSVYRNNPYGLISQSGYGNYFNRYLQGNVAANQKLDFLIKGLSLNGMFAFDSYKNYDRGKSKSFAVYQENQDFSYSKIGEDSELGSEFSTWSNNYYLLFTFTGGASFLNTFNNIHSVGADIKYMQSQMSVPGDNVDYKNQNVFGRLTYSLDKRYIAEFGWSYSGSENFIGSQRYAFYPAGSAAWVISNESFLKNNALVNFLKIRASYGVTGNSDVGIGRFPFETKFTKGGGYIFGSGYSGSDGSYEGRLSNPLLGPEKSVNGNIGFDLELYNGKLEINADIFRNERTRIITTRENTLPLIVGQSLPYENLGSVINKGFETSITHSGKKANFGYYVQAHISYAHNEISYTDEVENIIPQLSKIGQPVTQQWGLESAGFFYDQTEIDLWAKSTYGIVKPGDIKYIDQNTDGVINDDDRIPIGKPFIPEWNFGLTLGASYKNLDFNILFAGVTGRSFFVSNNVLFGMQNNNKITATAIDAWQQGVNESTAVYPRLTTEANNHNYRANDIWLLNGEYLRLQNAELGYTLPKHLLSKFHIRELRVFINGYNLFSLDHLKKFNLSAEYPDAGVTTYPETRVYNIGVNLKF